MLVFELHRGNGAGRSHTDEQRRPRRTRSVNAVGDRWAAGSTYEAYMGRWSRRLAPRFVSWLDTPRGMHWLDVGCGTGALAEAICQEADPASVVGCDPATPFIEFARDRSTDPRVTFVTRSVGELPDRRGGYGSTTSMLALNFFPDALAAIREMRSRTSGTGIVSACVWDYGDRMELLRHFWDVAARVDAGARTLDEGTRFPLCRPDRLLRLFQDAGLGAVHCEAIDIETEFDSFGDYWQPFLGGTGPAPSFVASLDDAHRMDLARQLEDALPRRPDGTISLTARAWAVAGTA
jgi:SAM-dependent methyltransferase